jgi:hypothetical protein
LQPCHPGGMMPSVKNTGFRVSQFLLQVPSAYQPCEIQHENTMWNWVYLYGVPHFTFCQLYQQWTDWFLQSVLPHSSLHVGVLLSSSS